MIESPRNHASLRLALILCAIAFVFFIDRLTPRGLAVEILYVPILFYTAWSFNSKTAWRFYLLCSVFTVIDVSLEISDLRHRDAFLRLWNSGSVLFIAAMVTGLASRCAKYAAELRNSCNSLAASQQHARRSEALYRSLIDSIPQCVFRKDLDGRFTYANSNFCKAAGRPADEIVGATDFDYFPQHLAEKYRADDRHVAATGRTLEVVEDLQLPDGKVCQLQTVKSPVFDLDGHIVGTQGIFWDITEKLHAEQLLRHSELKFRTLAENLPDIVARFDRQFRHVYVNRSVQAITGLSPESYLGKTNIDVGSPPHLVPLWHRAMQTVFDTAVPQTIEFAYDSAQGARHFESRLIPETAPNGSVDTVLVISRDVTDRIRAQEQAQVHLAELAHATRLSMIGGLVSEIAHEINQPLHAIANFSQAGLNVLGKIPLQYRSSLSNWLTQISQQSQRAAEIIRSATRFVRKAPARADHLDINNLIRDSLLLVNFDLRLHHAILRCELDDKLPPVLADPVQIQQVLMNLLRNAMEAVSDNEDDCRQLLVRTSAVDHAVQVSVHDNGRGIPPESLPQLFEPFFTTKSDGIGLGLAVSHSIIQSHRGRLWAQNNPDYGAAFYFTLPIMEKSQHVACSV